MFPDESTKALTVMVPFFNGNQGRVIRIEFTVAFSLGGGVIKRFNYEDFPLFQSYVIQLNHHLHPAPAPAAASAPAPASSLSYSPAPLLASDSCAGRPEVETFYAIYLVYSFFYFFFTFREEFDVFEECCNKLV